MILINRCILMFGDMNFRIDGIIIYSGWDGGSRASQRVWLPSGRDARHHWFSPVCIGGNPSNSRFCQNPSSSSRPSFHGSKVWRAALRQLKGVDNWPSVTLPYANSVGHLRAVGLSVGSWHATLSFSPVSGPCNQQVFTETPYLCHNCNLLIYSISM